MEQFLYYLLRASVLMALFYGFYKLFFGKNTFHHFNRFTLIFTVMLVVVLPVFRFNLIPEKKAEPVVIENLPIDFSDIPIVEISELPAQPIQIPWIEMLAIVFAIGFLFALLRYAIGLNQLISTIRKSEKRILADETVLCVTDKEISPFSWMKYIVLSRKDATADNRAIISHERAHIHLLHSFDMIFIDLFTCVFWFNPFSWLLRREVQSVHEYQADEQVLNNGIDAKQYQLLLIRKSVGEHKFALANNFRQRDLHKRITMMMKTKSNKRTKWNYTAALPVLFLALIALSVPKLNAKVVEKNIEEETVEIQTQDSVMIADAVDLSTNPLELGNVKIVSSENFKDERISVSGRVVDEKGNGIASVAIINDTDKSGTVSDKNGNFVLNTQKGARFFFKYLGYADRIVTFTKSESNFKLVLSKGKDIVEELITVNVKNTPDATQDESKVVISGTVKEADGGVIAGVAILVKDSKTGSVTDPNGRFVIKAEKGSTLQFMMIGYDKFEYKVQQSEKNLVVLLKRDKKDLPKTAGKQSGFYVNGVQLGGKPLYILDGKELTNSDLKLINPNNIENITVLKNKSTTELYGEKGKDGVILITTKKPEKFTLHFEPDKKPVIVVDGEKMPNDFELNTVKPDDIESMMILKDKSAEEKYGEEGKNGVVIITKKKETN